MGTVYRGAKPLGPVRCLSGDRQQQFLGSVPVDSRDAKAGSWHVVRFNPKLPFRATPTIVLEEDTVVRNPEDRVREAGLTVAHLDPVMRQLGMRPTATLRVHVPRAAVSAYERNVYSATGDVMDRPLRSTRVVRTDESPIVFDPDPVLPGHRYVVEWSTG